MSIALVGMPGGGKSTVGRQLAKRLGWAFADSDAVIEGRIGTSIREYFESHGERLFRDIESSVIVDLVNETKSVIATGGGAILNECNRHTLRERCRVVYLRSSPDELYRRLRHDVSRPLLQVANPLARLRELFEARDALYREAAHFTVETGRPSPSTLVNMVLMQLELSGDVDRSLVPSPVETSRRRGPAS